MSIIVALFFLVLSIICILGIWVFLEFRTKKAALYELTRDSHNPLISPSPKKPWTASGTLNPAAVEDDEGNVHLFYRAIGADGVSRIGYAVSKDGMAFDDHSPYPVFQPITDAGLPDQDTIRAPHQYNPAIYTSGGGWAGSEDPRAVRIGDRVYMTYTAFGGWDSMRIAMTSINLKDLKQKRWNWKRPRPISPAGTMAKNWVLFPEKINGRYALVTSIVPEIEVTYVDHLDFVLDSIKSARRYGPQPGRPDFWDNSIRGAGPPPLRTNIGWLLLYHAMDQKHDPNKYKVGAMILKLSDPSIVLYRSPTPILDPKMPYENDGKPGVVYATGAVIKGNDLFVYYGGGDKHICVAETPLQPLLDWLVKYGKV